MISALFYLQFNSVRNRLRARLRRLKRPKYLIGAIFGGLYLVFNYSLLVFMPVSDHAGGANSLISPDLMAGLESLATVLLMLFMLLGWLLPNERAALAFSEAEVAFLFPAPITRRGLLHYKLVSSQIRILFSTLFLTLVFGRWLYGGHVWVSILGWWVILSTLNLNLIAASFARSLLFDRGITNWKRRAIILIGLAVVLGAVCYTGWQSWPSVPSADASFTDIVAWLHSVLSAGVTPYLLYPFGLVVRPYFAPDALSFLIALGPALAILALHYFLVIRADVAFEEASVGYSQKLATRIAAMRNRRVAGALSAPKKKRDPFKLTPTGLPSMAFLWKNLILAGNYFTAPFYIIMLIALILGGMIMQALNNGSLWLDLLGAICLMLAWVSLLIGPIILRMDFRSDLNHADQLKLYPLPGWQIVLGEVLAPVVILATAQWLLILAAVILLTPTGEPAASSFPLGLRVSIALTAALLAPAVDFVMLIIPNAVALLMPSWVRFDKNAPRGIENFGQNIILMIGQMFVVGVALLPAGLLFWITFAIAGLIFSPTAAAPLAALAGAAILLAEGGGAIYLLGAAFESFDLSAELTT
jgi:uncharacterized MnhB-related membrane protein